MKKDYQTIKDAISKCDLEISVKEELYNIIDSYGSNPELLTKKLLNYLLIGTKIESLIEWFLKE